MGELFVLTAEVFAAVRRRPFAWREPIVMLSIPYTVLIVFVFDIKWPSNALLGRS